MAITQTRIARIVVEGAVQGVGYRVFVAREAGRLHLDGWVRNRRDGSVEALFVGPAKAVAGMIEACRIGPRSGRVDTLDQRDGSEDELKVVRPGDLFSVLGTA